MNDFNHTTGCLYSCYLVNDIYWGFILNILYFNVYLFPFGLIFLEKFKSNDGISINEKIVL
jgi:hypothetical protein